MWISGDSFIFQPRMRGVDLSNWQGWSLLLKNWFPTPHGNLAPDKRSWKLLGCACVFQGPLKWSQSHHSRPSSCCEIYKYSLWWTQWTAVQGLLKTWGEQTFVSHPAFSLLCIQTAQEDVLKADYCCQGNSRLILHSSKLNRSPWGLESVIGDSCLGGQGECFGLFLSLALSVPNSRESNFKLWRNSQFVNDCRWTEMKRPLGLQGKTSLEET